MNPLKELEGFDAPHQLALIKKLGGKVVKDAILRGEKTVTVEDAIRALFDKNGRRIPEGLQAPVRDANRSFGLRQPDFSWANLHNRIALLHNSLGRRHNTGIKAEELKAEAERLLAIIKEDIQIANIANGVCLPVILPKLFMDDLGAELELYLDGVKNSYTKIFGNRIFYNYCKGILMNKIGIIKESRHDQLISRMKEGPVIGLHFPNSLQGFSAYADHEQMLMLPEGFILSGMDTVIAIIMYPDILVCDCNVPMLNISALQWRYPFSSLLQFKTVDHKLIFNNFPYLPISDGYSSAGLLFIVN